MQLIIDKLVAWSNFYEGHSKQLRTFTGKILWGSRPGDPYWLNAHVQNMWDLPDNFMTNYSCVSFFNAALYISMELLW